MKEDRLGDEVRLQHILAAIGEINQYTQGVDFSSFETNSMMLHACIRQLEIIGEASTFGSSFTHLIMENTLPLTTRPCQAINMAHLFTIICEYRGGTYTKQLRAEHPAAAFAQWAEHFAEEGILKAPERVDFQEGVRYSLEENSLVALEGLQNIWCDAFSLDEDLLEVLVVGTSVEVIPVGSKRPSHK